MPAGIGYRFQPGTDVGRPEGQGQGSYGRSGLSPQQVVRLLSLRIPERPSPTAIAPQALLRGAGGAGAPGGGSLQAIIQALMTMFAPQGPPGLMGAAAPGLAVPQAPGLSLNALPPPRVRPGLEAPTAGGLEPQPDPWAQVGSAMGGLFGGAPPPEPPPIDLSPNTPPGMAGGPTSSLPPGARTFRNIPMTKYNPGTSLF